MVRTGFASQSFRAIALLAIAGCTPTGRNSTGGGSFGGDMAKHDLAFPGFGPDDMAMMPEEMPDLVAGPDLGCASNGANGQTGDPCCVNTDCQASLAGTSTSPQCIRTLNNVVWPNGYCSSPCRPSLSDMATGLNSDCPSDAAACQAVSQTAGRCVKLCMDYMQDCRFAEGYVCENNTTYAASCTPKGPDWCDPMQPNNCPKAQNGNAQVCVSFSPDDSAGQCAEKCDVFKQICTPPAMGVNGCLANPTTGDATCINVGTSMDGDACHYLNECVKGLACHLENNAGVCRRYCGGPNNVACPQGQMCTDLSANVSMNVIGICSL